MLKCIQFIEERYKGACWIGVSIVTVRTRVSRGKKTQKAKFRALLLPAFSIALRDASSDPNYKTTFLHAELFY